MLHGRRRRLVVRAVADEGGSKTTHWSTSVTRTRGKGRGRRARRRLGPQIVHQFGSGPRTKEQEPQMLIMALDHALRRKERLDLLSQLSDRVVLLESAKNRQKKFPTTPQFGLLTLIQSGRFAPNPKHCRRRRTHVWHAPSSLGCSSHFCR